MALPPLVDTFTLAGWLGEDVLGDSRAEAVLSAVSAVVRNASGQTWAADGDISSTDVPELVSTVVLQVAARVWRNPHGVRQEATGPFSVSYAVTGVYLTADERRLLSGYRANSSGLWTMQTTRGDDYADTVYVPVVGTDAMFPFLTTEDV